MPWETWPPRKHVDSRRHFGFSASQNARHPNGLDAGCVGVSVRLAQAASSSSLTSEESSEAASVEPEPARTC